MELWAEECTRGSLEEVSGGGLSAVTCSSTQALQEAAREPVVPHAGGILSVVSSSSQATVKR